ncbi:MAG: hypothetical protein E7358_02200 [Clostridiales bacterium]|nr:hypothetical protein [Clostridiales bacterium]
MDALIVMLKNVIVFVLLAIPGYILVKAKLVKNKESAILSKLLTYVGMPFLIFSSTLNVKFTGEFTKSIIIVAIFGIIFTVLAFIISAILVKRGGERKKNAMMRFCMVFSNNGFLGIPLAKAVLGDSPVVAYLIILNIITLVIMFTLGIYLISGDKNTISVKKAILSPVLIAFILGIIVNLTGVTSYVPEVSTYSNYFSNVVTPLSMVILGIKMAEVKFLSIFTKWETYYVSAIKLIAMPVIAVGLAYLIAIAFSLDTGIVLATLFAFAVPTAGLSSAFADSYDGDNECAVILTLGTTILSVITIPILYWILCAII